MEKGIDNHVVFNRADLLERLDGDFDLVVELVELFLEDVEEKLRFLRVAIDGGNIPEAEKEAHSLKGAASNVAAEKVCHIAGVIEKACINQDMESVRAGWETLLHAVREVREVLQLEIADPAARK